MGEELALAAATIRYATPHDDINTLLLFGRVVKGDTGSGMVIKARGVLETEFSSLDGIDLMRPSEMDIPGIGSKEKEKLEALAQVTATLYLGNAARIENESTRSSSPGTQLATREQTKILLQINQAA